MKLRLTSHMKMRMYERGIESTQIRKVIQFPQTTKRDSDGTIVVKGSAKGDRTIVVVYKEAGKDTYVIITAYYAN